MAYSYWKLMGPPLPPMSAERDLLISRPVTVATKTTAFSLDQVKKEGGRNFQAPQAVFGTRRDTMIYMTAEVLSGMTMLSAEPAEARVTKLERRRKIMEKLEKLREKAGVSKPKTENKGDIAQAPQAPILPLLPQPLVEATLP